MQYDLRVASLHYVGKFPHHHNPHTHQQTFLNNWMKQVTKVKKLGNAERNYTPSTGVKNLAFHMGYIFICSIPINPKGFSMGS